MEEKVYDFCPKCGSLTLNGVCENCGKKFHIKRAKHSDADATSHVHSEEPEVSHSSGRRVLIGFVIAVIFISIIIPAFGAFQVVKSSIGSYERESKQELGKMASDEIPVPGDVIPLYLDEYSDEDGPTTAVYGEDGYVSLAGKTHDNYYGEEFSGDTYDEVVDWINEDVNYAVSRHGYDYYNKKYNISAEFSYVQLSSDEINEEILSSINDELARKVNHFIDRMSEMDKETLKVYANNHIVLDSYVTYNDEKKISVYCDYKSYYNGHYYNFVSDDSFSMNFDLESGYEIYNVDLIQFDDALYEEFMANYEAQNPKLAEQGITFNIEDVKQWLSDFSGIVFFTPMGMEIGFNYYNSDMDASGTVLVTFKDYEKYKKSMDDEISE